MAKTDMKSRQASTSKLSNTTEESIQQSNKMLSAFSSEANYFACIFPIVNRHCLRVYDGPAGRLIAEHHSEHGLLTALIWGQLHAAADPESKSLNQKETESSVSSKKRKKRHDNNSSSQVSPSHTPATLVVALGLSDGSIELYSPLQARVVRTLAEATSSHPITSIQFRDIVWEGESHSTVWALTGDGGLRVWNATKNTIIRRWTMRELIPYSTLAFTSHSDDGLFLAANTSVTLFSTPLQNSPGDGWEYPREVRRFDGHTSLITKLVWECTAHPRRFVSMSQEERFVNIWEVPQPATTDNSGLLASVALDQNVRHVCLDPNGTSDRQLLLALTCHGKICIFELPTKKLENKSTLLPLTIILCLNHDNPQSLDVVSASFLSHKKGFVRIASLLGGTKLGTTDIRYFDDEGGFLSQINLNSNHYPKIRPFSEGENLNGTSLTRYGETSDLTVRSGNQSGIDSKLVDSSLSRQFDGALDVDMAELSLGQRLSALHGGLDDISSGTSTRMNEKLSRRGIKRKDEVQSVPINSLSRTLIQALHASDARLLETCLSHSDPIIIRNTIRRLPAELVVPLISACIERLGRGHRGANLKGGGAGASAQRGTGLITWVKTALVVHTGHLMAMPDLVARLSALHALLTDRLLLQDRLLSLSGKLDLVLTQMEIRSSSPPTRPQGHREAKKETRASERTEVLQYIEGESSDEEPHAFEASNPSPNSEEEEGSIEDIELGGVGAEQSSLGHESGSGSHDDSAVSEEEDSDASSVHMNGFIDTEANERSGEDEDDDDDEDEDDEDEDESD